MCAVFLDIDGVLNSERYVLKLEERHRQLGHEELTWLEGGTTCDCFKLYHQIDPEAVARVSRIERWSRDTGEVLSPVGTDRMSLVYEMGQLRGRGDAALEVTKMFDEGARSREEARKASDDDTE